MTIRIPTIFFAILLFGVGSFTAKAQCSLVKDITPNDDSWPANYTDVNGSLFFSIGLPNGARSLYKTDGTDAGTTLIKQMPYTNIGSCTSFNGKLMLFGSSSTSGAADLVSSDGTAAGTVTVKSFLRGTQYAKGFHMVGQTAYFTGADNAAGAQLWKTDGTTAGTMVLTDVGATTSNTVGIQELVSIGNTLYFITNVGTQFQRKAELWKTDGTLAGTSQISSFTTAGGNSIINQMTVVNGVVYFFHDDYFGPAGQELWKSDGTAAGTVMVKDAPPSNLFRMNDLLYFTIPTTGTIRQLWRSDGTAAGTASTGTFDLGQDGFNLIKLTVAGNKAYFYTGTNSTKRLYVTDGTGPGTTLLYNVAPASRNVNDIPMLAVGETIYFSRVFGAVVQIMKTQGTVAGSTMLCEYTYLNINEAFIYEIGRVNQTLYFAPYISAGGIGKELHKTNDITIANKERRFSPSITISPNPAQSSITLGGVQRITAVEAVGVSGTVTRLAELQGTVNISGLRPGLYTLRVQSSAGASVQRFIKE